MNGADTTATVAVHEVAALMRAKPAPGAPTIEVQQWLERKADLLQRIEQRD